MSREVCPHRINLPVESARGAKANTLSLIRPALERIDGQEPDPGERDALHGNTLEATALAGSRSRFRGRVMPQNCQLRQEHRMKGRRGSHTRLLHVDSFVGARK